MYYFIFSVYVWVANKVYYYYSQILSGEVEQMELLFKSISKSLQGLVQELSPEEIDRMMYALKQEKEQLVRVRANMSQKTHAITQVNPL